MIFVALALLWAVFLIPKALKHHDEVARTRSVDEVSDGVRVLARREAVTKRDARLVVGPMLTTKVAGPVCEVAPVAAPVTRWEARRAAAASAARRRRRVLVLLLLVAAAVGGAVTLGVFPVWAPAVPAGLVIAFLVLARVLVRREHAAWAADVRRVRSGETPAADHAAAPLPQETDVDGTPVVSATEATAAHDLGLLREAVVTVDSASLWDPLPVTLPTYVGKARATRSVRTIDLRDPRVSSSGRDEADSALVAEAEAAAAQTAERDAAPRRAVGS